MATSRREHARLRDELCLRGVTFLPMWCGLWDKSVYYLLEAFRPGPRRRSRPPEALGGNFESAAPPTLEYG